MSEQTPHSDSKPVSGSGTTPTTASGSWRSRTRTGSDTAIRKLGRFQILSALGKGAFGEVWRAYDPHLDREVALKIPRFEDTTGKEAERFFREARAAAQLQHPNIVAVHDAGQAEGQFYIASTFIDGLPLSVWLRENTPTFLQTAEVIRKLAEALHYAHSQGIFHRDIKPANVMITSSSPPSQGEPPLCPPLRKGGIEGGYEPHLMDFGLARRTDQEATMTTEGAVLGTPSYMSPEQAKGQSKQADARSDLYSLGVVLYEMLAGRKPFEGVPHVVINKVIHEEPEPPRKINPKVPLDLETITQKCMAKEPERRYPSAQHLADELRRWLNNEPIQARAAGRLEKARLWCRRNPVVAGTIAGASAVLAAVITLAFVRISAARDDALYMQGVAEQKEAEADRQRRDAQRRSLDLTIQTGLRYCEQGEVSRGLHWLVRALEATPAEDERLQSVLRANIAGWKRRAFTAKALLPQPQGQWARSARFSPDGRILAIGAIDITLWDTSTYEAIPPVLRNEPRTSLVRAIRFHPDGQRFVTFQSGVDAGSYQLHWWEASPPKHMGRLPYTFASAHFNFDLSPDGKTLAAGTEGSIRLIDATTGALLDPSIKTGASAVDVAFCPDGNSLLSAEGGSRLARRWDFKTRAQQGQGLPHPAQLSTVAVSPNAKWAATACHDNRIRLWDLAGGTPVGWPMLQPGQVSPNCLAFSPDSQFLLAGSGAKSSTIYHLASGQPLDSAVPHRAVVEAVSWGNDSRTFVVVGGETTARVWQMPEESSAYRPLVHRYFTYRGAYSNDGGTYAKIASRGQFGVYDSVTHDLRGPLIQFEDYLGTSVALGAKGLFAVNRTSVDQVELIEVATGKGVNEPIRFDGPPFRMSFSDDGSALLLLAQGKVHVWSVSERKFIGNGIERKRTKGFTLSAAVSSDGKRVAVGTDPGFVQIFDPSSGEEIGTPISHSAAVLSLTFSRDGKKLLAGCADRTAHLWDVETQRRVGNPLAHQGSVDAVAFAPDGSTVVTGTSHGKVHLWDVATSLAVGPPLAEQAQILAVAYDAAGTAFRSLSFSGSPSSMAIPQPVKGDVERIRLWIEVVTATELGEGDTLRLLDAAEWNKRKQRLADLGGPPVARTPSETSGTGVRYSSCRELFSLPGHKGRTMVAFSPDGKTVVTCCEDNTIRMWDAVSGKKNLELSHQAGTTWSTAFSPDGKTLAANLADSTLSLWDLATGQERRAWVTAGRVTMGVAFSPDGQMVATGAQDGIVRLWDFPTGKERAALGGHTNWVVGLAFSPDGKTLASGSWDTTAKLWDVATGEERATLKGHTDRIVMLAFSSDGKTVATGSWDKTIKLWDVSTGKERRSLQKHQAAVYGLAFSPDGKTLASGSNDGAVRLWDLASGSCRATLIGNRFAVRSLAYSPDGKALAVSGWGGEAKLLLLPDDKQPVAAGFDGEQLVWQVFP